MKKIILASVLSAVMATGGISLYAQGWGRHMMYGGGGYHHGYGMAYGHIENLKEELKLTDSQVEKIIKIDADFRLKYYQNRESIEKIIVLRDEHRKAVYNVLTDEQKKKFDANFSNQRGSRFCPYWN